MAHAASRACDLSKDPAVRIVHPDAIAGEVTGTGDADIGTGAAAPDVEMTGVECTREALVALLMKVAGERTTVSRLLDEARQDGCIVYVDEAGTATKDELKRRGYRCRLRRQTWWREVAEGRPNDGRAWLEENACAERARAAGIVSRGRVLDHCRPSAEGLR